MDPANRRKFAKHDRILILAPQPFYEDRGTPIALRQVLEALSELGRDVDLLTYPMGSSIPLQGVRYFRCGNPLGIRRLPVGFSLKKVALDVSLARAAFARLRRRSYSAIHAVEEAAFIAAPLGRLHGIPVIYDMQSCLPEQLSRIPAFRLPGVDRMLRACERWLLRRVDLVVSSAGLAEYVRRTAPGTDVREWHFCAAPAPPDPEQQEESLRSELGIPAGSPVVLYSGTFEAYQGLDDLFAAIPLVLARRPDAVFVLVGGEECGPVPAAIPEAALRLVGRQPRTRIPRFLAMADVLVSPRKHGGNLPLKVFDYLQAGRPIVATDVPAHRAVLDEQSAFLVDPSPAAIAAGIECALGEPETVARTIAAARDYADRNLGWPRFVQLVEDLQASLPGIPPERPATA